MDFTFSSTGDYSQTESWLKGLRDGKYLKVLDAAGSKGVNALSKATPVASGRTAGSWSYEVKRKGQSAEIVWKNDHIENGFNVAVGLQYGHGTRNGGYVRGIDYINPALRPIFEQILRDVEGALKSG